MTSWILRSRYLPVLALLLVATAAAGCAAPEPAENAEPAPAAAPEAVPEVFFTSVEDGGTYSSPVELVFGVQGFAIVPVEDPPAVRPGEGHYHLAVDVPCAPAGQAVVKGSPSYIHFGSGADRISMQFEAGEHSLCLQVADGEHRVLEGPEASALTKQIHITVE